MFDALKNKYLKAMTFAIMTEDEKLLETYTFMVTYDKIDDKMIPSLNGLQATKENLKVKKIILKKI